MMPDANKSPSSSHVISQVSQEVAVIIVGCIVFVLCAVIVAIVVYGEKIKTIIG